MKKILYDATALGFGQTFSDDARTGIYVCAYNILEKFLDSGEMDITLYCKSNYCYSLQQLCKQEFSEYKLNIISENSGSPVSQIFYKLDCICIHQRKNVKSLFLRKMLSLLRILFSFLGDKFIRIGSFRFENQSRMFDIYFSPYHSAPKCILSNHSIKRFTLLHDVIPLVMKTGYYSSRELNQPFYELIEAINKEDYYFANSQYTKSDFCKYVPAINPEKVYVTPLAASSRFHLVSDDDELLHTKRKYGIDEDKKYVFSLCTLIERKNLVNACLAFLQFIKENQINDMVFVLGGAMGHLFLESIRPLVDEEDLKNIQYVGYVDDDDLAALCSGASWFVYTSCYEGFGLPILEAMQCGCPVITSKSTSLPEVVGDAGLLIDYDSIEQHVEAYKKYYYNNDLRNQNAKNSLARAELFSWDKTVNAMIDVLKKVSEENETITTYKIGEQ